MKSITLPSITDLPLRNYLPTWRRRSIHPWDIDNAEYWARNASKWDVAGSWRVRVVDGALHVKMLSMQPHWAERTSVLAYLLISVLVSGVIYSLAVRIAWADGGWLTRLDPPFVDFAGSGVVHLVGGSAALVGAAVVGPRHQRWERAHASKFVPHNVPSVMGGVMLLWVGWYGSGIHTVPKPPLGPVPSAH